MQRGLILWLLGGGGVFLLYCAVRNVSPTSLLESYFTGKATTPLVGASKAATGKAGDGSGTDDDPLSPGFNAPNQSHLGIGTSYIDGNGNTVTYPAAYVASGATYIPTTQNA